MVENPSNPHQWRQDHNIISIGSGSDSLAAGQVGWGVKGSEKDSMHFPLTFSRLHLRLPYSAFRKYMAIYRCNIDEDDMQGYVSVCYIYMYKWSLITYNIIMCTCDTSIDLPLDMRGFA